MQDTFEVIFIPQIEGGYTIEVPILPGCITEAETVEEGKEKILEAIHLYLETLINRNIPLPQIPSNTIKMNLTIPSNLDFSKQEAYA